MDAPSRGKSKREINENKAAAANITHLYHFNVILAGGFLLSLGAGFVGGASLAGLYAAPVVHMSGNALRTGVALAQLEWIEMFNVAFVWVFFLVGSAISAFMVSATRKFRLKRIYGLALVIESVWLLMAYFTSQDGREDMDERLVWVSEYFAAMAMGMQNALCTTYSGAVIRTTHVTGSVTDIGMAIGHELRIRFGLQLYKYLKRSLRDFQHRRKWGFTPSQIQVDPTATNSTSTLRIHIQEPDNTLPEESPEPSILWRLKVLIPLLAGYIVGAALGTKAYIAWGREALLAPILFIGIIGLVYGVSTHLMRTYRRVRSLSTRSGQASREPSPTRPLAMASSSQPTPRISSLPTSPIELEQIAIT